ncbi:MAG: Ig-like domain-containing protein, partial [Pyrinomonadaceae bacterium]
MKRLTAWALIFSTFITFIAPASMTASAQAVGKAMDNKIKDLPDGLKFRLSEGVEGAEKREKPPLSATDPLSQGDANNLLKRIPEIKSVSDDQTEFAKRVGTLPAPKTGVKIPVKFPSDEQRAEPAVDTTGKTLEIIRFSPEGEVPLAPDLSVTFSQPMVAVTSQEEAAQTAPVELTPQVEGRWRWLGTRTLMFDTTKRFPMATKFTARIPAGIRSATGQVLQKDFTWTFTTPPPKVETMIPKDQIVKRDALMFVSFDQEINPEAVLASMSVTAGGKKLAVRLATPEEINRDGSITYYISQAQPKRWLVFRAVNADGSTENALPSASTITVSVNKGTPSAEGPLTTPAAQTFNFQTYSPLKFAGAYCGWRENKNCSPFESWYLEFNNAIEASKFTKEMITIEPAVEGLSIYPSGNNVYIQGYKKGRTTYKITVSGALADIFGQTLGQSATATIKVGSAEQNLYAQGGFMSVLDPTAKPSFSIYSTNHTAVKVRLYKVEPRDWRAYQEYVRRLNYDAGDRPSIPGRLISDKVVTIEAKPDEMVETRIDIGPALDAGFGNVIVDIEPTVKRDKYDRTRVLTWLQATQIGLDAFVDNTDLIGFATDLKTGAPLSGVELSIYPNGKAMSQLEVPEPGVLDKLIGWIHSFGGPSADEVQSLDADGPVAPIEPVEPTQTDRTGANGILRLTLPETSAEKAQNMLIAKRGKDTAFLPENTDYYWQDSGSWYRKEATRDIRWFVFDDRKMYKPKEEVSIKGWLRMIDLSKLGDVEPMDFSRVAKLEYKVSDSRGNEITAGETTVNPFGGFDIKAKLPDNVNLGYANVSFTLKNVSGGSESSYNHQFQIQEFRRPEFEVTTKVETEAPHFVGGSAMVSVDAKYYAGGALANAETNWTVSATATNYTPPNRDEYTFGTWTPWWRIYDHREMSYGGRP